MDNLVYPPTSFPLALPCPLNPSLQNGSSVTQQGSPLFLSQRFVKILLASSQIKSRTRSAYMGSFARKLSFHAFSKGSDAYRGNVANDRQVTPESTRGNGAAPGTDGNMLEPEENGRIKTTKKEELMHKLRRYGVAGILSYGLFNTVYYLGTFLFVWFCVAPSAGGLGYKASAERFMKILAVVWAGSQVTKLLRAGCALALAPAIDKCLSWFTNHFKFESRGKAFGAIVSACFGLALMVFFVVTYLWA